VKSYDERGMDEDSFLSDRRLEFGNECWTQWTNNNSGGLLYNGGASLQEEAEPVACKG